MTAGGASTGAAVNPARALGPAVVFHCHWNKVWLYVIAGDATSCSPLHTLPGALPLLVSASAALDCHALIADAYTPTALSACSLHPICLHYNFTKMFACAVATHPMHRHD